MADGHQFFDGLQTFNEDSLQKILVSMMSPEGIETKTEIDVPQSLAQLDTLASILKSQGFIELADWIFSYIRKYLTYQVSKEREGRKEIFRALTEGIKEERALREKLTSPPEV